MSDQPKESKKPKDTKFKQQNLPAWKPILTPRTVLPTLFGIGIVFLAIGIALTVASQKVKEQEWDYTECKTDGGQVCADLLATDSSYTNHSASSLRCVCNVPIILSKSFDDSETFLYYALENYYQNHRRYVKSRWDPQLRAKSLSGGSDCDPLAKDAAGAVIAPCGLIANSFFNDTIELYKCPSNAACDSTTVGATKVTLSGSGIAWASDRDVRFQNPDDNTCGGAYWGNTVKPPNWLAKPCEIGTNTVAGNPWSTDFGSSGIGYENEDFIVWMRTAALPNFRKLYRKVKAVIGDGFYSLKIGYNYPVTSFDGKKKVVLSTTSWIGGENLFLGVMYIVVSMLCLITAVFFVVFQKVKGRKLGDEQFLRWDN